MYTLFLGAQCLQIIIGVPLFTLTLRFKPSNSQWYMVNLVLGMILIASCPLYYIALHENRQNYSKQTLILNGIIKLGSAVTFILFWIQYFLSLSILAIIFNIYLTIQQFLRFLIKNNIYLIHQKISIMKIEQDIKEIIIK
ncbi:Transmembrane domain-containing protein [Spironucleus salmonicida]|uniref:Transmembrane domain-containing protein n=1 Tax=Spironucleus salmonicida TaxID=348837 RepID=A0A9P8LWH6_9EUKA|nr:Transmembrane domain-containing protein [Spironucleus salmonicida]